MRRVSVLFACIVAVVAALVVSAVPAGARPAPRVTLHNVHPSVTTKQQPEFTFRAFDLRSGSRVALQERRGTAWKTLSTTQKLSYRARGWFRLGRPAKAGQERYRAVVMRNGKVRAASPTRTVRVTAAKG